ncbi:hypothetical protein TOPH_01156 [Tolypocladium ophioglossoides CBS 100239]|uniref:Perilipin MPL1-like protein n=1 Tax=Tolypocladium ophioglossoides (strain CBS 100239) TaxID=1163406 RepID=A0A0L0NJ96_TOLOC|nr:hypothetical protein TOPH_01156 [Tolypocladium ophioglossoides CBS 100239]
MLQPGESWARVAHAHPQAPLLVSKGKKTPANAALHARVAVEYTSSRIQIAFGCVASPGSAVFLFSPDLPPSSSHRLLVFSSSSSPSVTSPSKTLPKPLCCPIFDAKDTRLSPRAATQTNPPNEPSPCTMAVPQVNGDVSGPARSSAFIQHLLNYPLISDGITTFSSNEYAQRSIRLGDSAYQTFAAPVIPWFAKPYTYISPYVQRADSIGDKTLDRIDERFPVVKKPTGELYNDTRSLILLPYNKGIEGRDHVFHIYATEAKKTEQQGLVGQGKAAVSTALVVSNETLSWLSSLITAKKAEATKLAHEKIQQ